MLLELAKAESAGSLAAIPAALRRAASPSPRRSPSAPKLLHGRRHEDVMLVTAAPALTGENRPMIPMAA
jgi:hypothetical protein